jgi:hypothetical protein
MLPSQFAESTGRPAQFAAPTFCQRDMETYTVEIMTWDLDAAVFDTLLRLPNLSEW